MKRLSDIALVAAGVSFLVLAQYQPHAGKHSWLLGLAGDWSVRVGETPYEIARMPDESGRFFLFRWQSVGDAEIMEPLVHDVRAYSEHPDCIVVETHEGFKVVDVRSGTVTDLDPQSAAVLMGSSSGEVRPDQMNIPQPSRRRLLQLLGTGFVGIGIVMLARGLLKRTAKGAVRGVHPL